jgi:hypothetical protein
MLKVLAFVCFVSTLFQLQWMTTLDMERIGLTTGMKKVFSLVRKEQHSERIVGGKRKQINISAPQAAAPPKKSRSKASALSDMMVKEETDCKSCPHSNACCFGCCSTAAK